MKFTIKNIIYCLSLLVLGALGTPNLVFAQTTSPNVIVILADDMGWNDVGYHGSEIKTPTLDRLASEGVELNRYYVHPACTPTRSSMMTGKAAVRLGMMAPLYKNAVNGLPLSETIMPQYFKRNDYQTWLLGKWHLGRFKKENWPYNRGFDHFYGYLTGGIGHYDHVHGGGIDWQRNGETVIEEGYTTHLITNEAVKLIKEKPSDKPFFLEVCYAAPHLPNEAPETSKAEYANLPNKKRGIHAAMVNEIDKGVQQIYETLEKEGLLDNTIIWFSSDNGGLYTPPAVKKNHLVVQMAEEWGRPLPLPYYDFIRDNIENGGSDNSPLKGGKRTVYEGGVRVPAFVYAPKYLKQQKIDNRITVNDLLPTLATAAGFKDFDFDDKDGASQWGFLTQKEGQVNLPDYIVQSRGNYAFFRDNWKLIQSNDQKVELFDLVTDPLENTNVAAEYPKMVTALKKAIADFPKGKPIEVPLNQHIIDPDFFGGEIDRLPWASIEGKHVAKASVSTNSNNKQVTENKIPSLPVTLWGPLGLLIGIIGFNLGRRKQ